MFQMFLLQRWWQDWIHYTMLRKLLMIMPVGRLSREMGNMQTPEGWWINKGNNQLKKLNNSLYSKRPRNDNQPY